MLKQVLATTLLVTALAAMDAPKEAKRDDATVVAATPGADHKTKEEGHKAKEEGHKAKKEGHKAKKEGHEAKAVAATPAAGAPDAAPTPAKEAK